MNKSQTDLAVNGTMDTGCSQRWKQEWGGSGTLWTGNWVVRQHTRACKVAWLAESNPKAQTQSEAVNRQKTHSRNLGGWER